MANSYFPAVGTTGTVILNNTTLCADEWDYRATTNWIPVPSFCGGNYMEFVAGKKTGVFSFSGTWDLGKNPFGLGFKNNAVVNFTFSVNNQVFAVESQVTIIDWHVHDEADGVCRYTCVLGGSFTFNDLSNTAA